MLETVVVSPYIVSEPSWTLGDLAELMFFYKEVKLYISEHTLDRLVTRAGGELTVRLIEDGYIECHYMREMVALHNLKQGQQFVAISLPGHSTAETIQAALYKGGVPGRDTRRMARRIADKVRHFNYAKEFAPGLNMLDQFRMGLGSEEYVRRNFVSLHNELWPGQPLGYEPYFRLRMVNYKGGIFKIETNMRFNDFESSPRSDILMLEPKTLSAETFAFSVNAATFDTFVAAQNRADVLTSDLSRIFCANRLLSAASVLGSKSEALARFQELVFPEGRTISVVVGNDRQKFAQFIDFVESKDVRRFREWLSKVDKFDPKAIQEYIRVATSDSWLEALPVKSFRLLVQQALPSLWSSVDPIGGPMVGTALAAADTFLLEKIAGGWNPKQFVSGPMKAFLKPIGSQ